ncbi:4068_t:CDS:2, partial [Gigaspora rosea]
AFPNVNESLIDPLVYVLALIWDIEAGENDSPGPQKDPYVNLKAEPSFFKARLPRGITKQTHTTVDLCLPSYESGTVSYHNPFYDDPQFKETVSFVKEKIENNIRDIIVLAGVSGGGKTATTFGIAVQRWSIYIDFSPSIGTYGDHVGKELIKTKIKQPKFEQHDQQDHVFRMLDTVILSRGLLLIKMLIEKNILTPKEWLFAQLRMNDNKIRMKLADENYDIFKVNSLIESIKTCRNVESLTLIFDEAQVLCRSEYGEYKGSSVPNKKWNLLQVYVEHLTHLPVTCLLAEKNQEIIKLIEKWYKKIRSDMAEYLENACKYLKANNLNPDRAIIDVLRLRVFYNQKYESAIKLLQHSIIPCKSPECITLESSKTTSGIIEINTSLESYLVSSIELFLKNTRRKTLIEFFIDEIIKLDGIPSPSIGNEFDAIFIAAIIQKRGLNAREELNRWKAGQQFDLPSWITPTMEFVTISNLSRVVPMAKYVEDETYRYYAIQPDTYSGSDLMISLVDDKQNVVLLSASCTVSVNPIEQDK